MLYFPKSQLLISHFSQHTRLTLSVSHENLTENQHFQYQCQHTETAKWNLAIIYFIIQACDFSIVTCQNVFREKTTHCVHLLISFILCDRI